MLPTSALLFLSVRLIEYHFAGGFIFPQTLKRRMSHDFFVRPIRELNFRYKLWFHPGCFSRACKLSARPCERTFLGAECLKSRVKSAEGFFTKSRSHPSGINKLPIASMVAN